MLLIIASTTIAYSQNNPYNINDKLYSLFLRIDSSHSTPQGYALIDSFIQESAKMKDVKAQCIARLVKCRAFVYQKSYNETLHKKMVKETFDFCVHNGYAIYGFQARNSRIGYLCNQRRYDEALSELRVSQELARKNGEPEIIARSFYITGQLYKSMGIPTLASDNFYKAIKVLQEAHETKNLFVYYTSIAGLTKEDEALKYYKLALENCPVDVPRLNILYHIIFTLTDMKSSEDVVKHYFHQLTELEDSKGIIHSSKYFSSVVKLRYYSYIGDYEKAKTLVHELEKYDNNDAHMALSLYYERIGNISLALEHYKRGSDMLLKSITDKQRSYLSSLSSEHENAILTIDKQKLQLINQQITVQNQKMQMDKINSERNILLGNRLRDSLTIGNKELQIINDSISHDKEVLHLNAEKSHNSNIFLLFIGLLLLVLIVIIIVIYQRYTHRLIRERNITAQALKEKNRALEAEEQALEKANQADRMKGVFLQNMSHDMRAPLGAIATFNDILNSDTAIALNQEDKNDMLKMIHQNVELITTLLNDILDVSKLENGSYQANISQYSVSDLCLTSAATVQSRVMEGVELRCVIPPKYADLIINTDAQRVSQLLNNFLTNACKHTENGSITLTYDVISEQDNSCNKLVMSVTDTGCGIPTELSETIFNRFEMIGSKKMGTGLGLNICKCIADLIHGKVYLDTTYTGGARFVFEHPID